MTKTIIILALTAITTGCSIPTERVARSTNGDAKVDVLFDVDGYRVYRFGDGLRTIYFVLPATGERRASVMWDSSCGKDCTDHQRIETLLPQ